MKRLGVALMLVAFAVAGGSSWAQTPGGAAPSGAPGADTPKAAKASKTNKATKKTKKVPKKAKESGTTKK